MIWNDKALIEAVYDGDLKTIKYLIEQGADIHAQNDQSLKYSAKNENLEIIKYFIEQGADIHAQNDKALIEAAHKGKLEIVEYFVEQGSDIHVHDDYIKINFPDIYLSIKENTSIKPLRNITDSCHVDRLSDKDITTIAKLIGLRKANKLTLCKGIADYFKKESQFMKLNVEKCITESVLSGDLIKDIHPLFFTMYQQGNHIHCGDIRELIQLDKNPLTNIEFTKEQKKIFFGKIDILQSFIENLNDDDEIIMSVNGLIKNATLKFTELLRYPNSIDLYVNSSLVKINDFINDLSIVGILNISDILSLNSVTIESTKKITLANVLYEKLKNASDLHYIGIMGISSISVTLEEVYNKNFSN